MLLAQLHYYYYYYYFLLFFRGAKNTTNYYNTVITTHAESEHLHAPSQHNKKKLIHAHSHLVNLGTQDQQGLLEYLHSLLIRVRRNLYS